MDKINVIMFGPHLTATSGISNVVNNWLSVDLQRKVNFSYISTLKKYESGRYTFKTIEAVCAAVKLILLNNTPNDIVHIHISHGMSFYRKLIIFVLAKIKKIKTIVHLHGSEFEEFYYKAGRTEKRIIKWMFDSSDCLIALSKSWKQFIKSFSSNENIYVLHNGSNLNLYIPKKAHCDQGKQINISFMGRLGNRKGTYDLIKAFEKVTICIPNAHLLLGGDGDIEDVKNFIKTKKLDKKVDVLGWVSGQSKIEVFNKSDIYTLPSYNEGLPGSIIEAMSVGLPIVSTPVGGIPELVIHNHNGFLISPGNVSNLANCIILLCKNMKLRIEMGKASRKIVEKDFNIEKIVSDLYQIYTEVLST